jgi:shikimate 5-dehydrogenase
MKKEHGENHPSNILIVNRSIPRLEEIKHIHIRLDSAIDIDYIHSPSLDINDRIINNLKDGSLVINATGLGKDIPGSPLSDNAIFPMNGFAWDFNYRGNLIFLNQARNQQKARNLTIEDGWVYFIHGWTQVIPEVFQVEIPSMGEKIYELSKIAEEQRL